MHIAICEDDAIQAGWLTSTVQEYFKKIGQPLSILGFDNGFKLMDYLDENVRQLDLIFLDIMMPGMNGMDTARAVRQIDETVPIVFITAWQDFALDGYQVDASGYLIKPVDKNQIAAQMEKILRKHQDGSTELTVQSSRKVFRVPVRSICYIEKDIRKTIVHLNDGQALECSKPIKEFRRTLERHSHFIFPHQSYMVNIHYITLVDQAHREIQMQNGEKIPVARERIKETLDAFVQMLGGAR